MQKIWVAILYILTAIAALIIVFGLWIGAILYVEWSGHCVRQKLAMQQEINVCLNPRNW